MAAGHDKAGIALALASSGDGAGQSCAIEPAGANDTSASRANSVATGSSNKGGACTGGIGAACGVAVRTAARAGRSQYATGPDRNAAPGGAPAGDHQWCLRSDDGAAAASRYRIAATERTRPNHRAKPRGGSPTGGAAGSQAEDQSGAGTGAQ